MSSHWIGKKKIEKFSRKTGINFIAGENRSGTTMYLMLCKEDHLHLYNNLNGVIFKLNEHYFNYKAHKKSLKLRAAFLLNDK